MLRAVDDYYSTRLRGFGPVHLGVDWRSEESQRLRFDVLLQAIRPTAAFSLIDYGCGYGALADYLAVRELHNCEYVGYDISDAMIEAARSRPCPLISCRYAGRNDALPEGDYCVASGVFNVRLGTEPEVWFEYMTHVAFAFNCLSAASDVARRTVVHARAGGANQARSWATAPSTTVPLKKSGFIAVCRRAAFSKRMTGAPGLCIAALGSGATPWTRCSTSFARSRIISRSSALSRPWPSGSETAISLMTPGSPIAT